MGPISDMTEQPARPVLLVALGYETNSSSIHPFIHSSRRKQNSLATVPKEIKQLLTDAIGHDESYTTNSQVKTASLRCSL